MMLVEVWVKVGLFVAVWAICARMFYLNEQTRPADDRIADLGVSKLLALIWPLWIGGTYIALVGGLLWLVVQATVKIFLRVWREVSHVFHTRRNKIEELPCPKNN